MDVGKRTLGSPSDSGRKRRRARPWRSALDIRVNENPGVLELLVELSHLLEQLGRPHLAILGLVRRIDDHHHAHRALRSICGPLDLVAYLSRPEDIPCKFGLLLSKASGCILERRNFSSFASRSFWIARASRSSATARANCSFASDLFINSKFENILLSPRPISGCTNLRSSFKDSNSFTNIPCARQL